MKERRGIVVAFGISIFVIAFSVAFFTAIPEYEFWFALIFGALAVVVVARFYSRRNRIAEVHKERPANLSTIAWLVFMAIVFGAAYSIARQHCVVSASRLDRYPNAEPVFFPIVLTGDAREEEVKREKRVNIVNEGPNQARELINAMPGAGLWKLLTVVILQSLHHVSFLSAVGLIAMAFLLLPMSEFETSAVPVEVKESLMSGELKSPGETAWFDQNPLEFEKQSTRIALALLKRAYRSKAAIEQVAKLAGIQVGQVRLDLATDYLPMKVMEQAAREGRMTNLLAEVLVDEAARGIHEEMWQVLGDGAARVHRAALSADASFSRVARLPASSVPVLNQNTVDLQKIVNVLGHFSDTAMLRFALASREAWVARIDIAGKGGGTGWLVAPDIILTAYHVIENNLNELDRVTARFDYKFVPQIEGKLLSDGRTVKLASERPLLASSVYAGGGVELSEDGADDARQLDFALLRIAEKVGNQGLGPHGQGNEKRGWFRLPPDVHEFNPGEGLFVLGHPQLGGDEEAGPLKLTLALPSSAELTSHKTRVRYAVNTKFGNSGSPVMNQHLMPLALHHAGTENTPIWDVEQRWPGGFNQGVPLHLIVAEIHRQLGDSRAIKELSL